MAEETEKLKNPCVLIFGDGEEKALTKAVWSILSPHNLPLVTVESHEELLDLAAESVLIFIFSQGLNDKNNEIPRILMANRRVVADVVAITDNADFEERLEILGKSYDGLFNIDVIEEPYCQQIVRDRLNKAFIRLENRNRQEEYKRFEAAMAASPDAFIIFDENNRLFFVSEHYKKAYPQSGARLVRGLDVMEAFEMCRTEVGVTDQDPRYALMHAFWSRLDGEAEFYDNGRTSHIVARPLPDGQGTIVTTTDITRYITQQQELEEKSEILSESLDKEKEASAIQKQFINMVSHEFRTPLSIIDGNAQILFRRAQTLDKETIQQRSKAIRSAVSRLVGMMEGVLSSNMLRTGKLQLIREPVDLNLLIQELCEEHTDLSPTHTIHIDVDRLPKTVLLDKKLITLVISNLLSNAVKFTRENPEIIVRGWTENGQVILEFQDNGIGIPPNELEKIFDRYYRTTIASGTPGTGIGLSLAKDLTELHGGKIAVDSKMGQGTKFVISLPLEV